MASSSSSVPTRWKYDVFLSFRGEDTRKNFVDHLYNALKDKGIHRVFIDEEEAETGRKFLSELSKAIEKSRFFIIVFSENFASSTWCLNEVVEIIDCTEQTEQRAFPVFYNVDPSDVRKQKGNFGKAFAEHENGNSKENMQKWRIALSQAAGLCGYDSRNYSKETEFIRKIVDDMFRKVKPALLHLDNNLVGIDIHLKELQILLSKDEYRFPSDVKFVGIYGLGGIGKTTIAKAVYNMISDQFEECGYLENVREISVGSLQEQLLHNILRDKVHDGRSVIKNKLSRKKVLVFLDDVDQIDQLEKLAGNRDWFGPGSRIIITTRNEHLLRGLDERYKVNVLAQDESLELFSWKAFNRKDPTDDFVKLSNEVVNYTKGLPIALCVLGSFLYGRHETEWKSAIHKLKKVPDKKVTDLLKISYDGLEDNKYKDIFLDIACFFKGKDKAYVTKILDSCGFFAGIGIPVLIERSLISLSENNELLMHDLVQEMGRDIVYQESPKDPSKRSRLWLYKDIRYVLMNNYETQAVEAIMLQDLSKKVHLRVSANAFMKMNNLRFFKIYVVRVHLPQVTYLPEKMNNLRLVDWDLCPLEEFPSSFQPEKLVELSMHRSRIKQLWNGVKALGNLISIDLSYSDYLIELPDLTGARNLEKLILKRCPNMSELHPSVGLLGKLKYLSLRECDSLRSLPSNIEMASLETLDLSDCYRLEKLPELLGKMVRLSKLSLEATAISEVPSSIENITGLKVLDLSRCRKLKCLPSSICKLGYLEKLLLRLCSKLENLPENLGNLKSLVKLDLSYTTIKESPPSIVRLKNLQSLSFEGCKGTFTSEMGKSYMYFTFLRREDLSDFKLHNFSGLLCSLTYLNLSCCSLSEGVIPSDIGSLSSLETLDLSENNFVSLPFSISQLSRLTTLRLVGCEGIRELPELPSSVATVNARDCTSLERLSKLSTVFKPADVFFGFVNCFKFSSTSFSDAFRQFQYQAFFGNSEIFSMCLPGSDIPGWFSHKNEGSSVIIQLPSNWMNNTQLRGLAFSIVIHDGPNSKESETGFFRSGVDGGIIIEKSASSSAMKIEYMNCDGLEDDHVILGYISRASLKENEEKSQLEFHFWSVGEDLADEEDIKMEEEDLSDEEDLKTEEEYLSDEEDIQMEKPCVKTCGIHLIYDEDHCFKMLRI